MADAQLITEVADAVRVAAKLAPSVRIGPESRLVEDLKIDSLDLVGVLLTIQDRFGVEIDDDAVPQLRRIADLASYVAGHHESAAA